MTWFAIRHIPTWKIIPCANGRMDRGGSWVEPEHPTVSLPKIFTAERYAKGWLTTWLKGGVEQLNTPDYYGGVDGRNRIVPQPHRKREEYKIVEVEFTFK